MGLFDGTPLTISLGGRVSSINFQFNTQTEFTMSKEITAATFNRSLADAVRSVKSMRDRVQALIAFASRFYAEEGNGNTIYLTKILQAVIATPGLNTRGVQAYIQEVCNVRFVKNDQGEQVFKKVSKEGDNPATFNTNVLATPWYQWVKDNLGSNNAQADWTMEKYVKQVIAVLKKHGAAADDFAKALKRAA
jgi:hypothetical protein